MQNVRKHFTPVKDGRYELAKTYNLRTGCAVPESGIYRVLHSPHSLPTEVTLLGNHKFPRCSKCDEPVYFELVRSAPDASSLLRFQVSLYELPELAPQDETLAG